MFVPAALAATMLSPGATISGFILLSSGGPRELKLEISSDFDEDPTAIANSAVAGFTTVYVSDPEFPAAATQMAPCSVAQLTVVDSGSVPSVFVSPPMLMLRIFAPLSTAHWIPLIIQLSRP